MTAANQRRLTPILAGASLLLAVLWLALLYGWGSGVQWSATRAASPLPPIRPDANLSLPTSPAQFVPVWQQSLFSPDRSPESHAANGGSSLGDLALTGIILTPKLHMALLYDKARNHELRLREGQSLPDGSVRLVEVKSRSVILDSPQGRTELKLPAGAPFDDTKAPPASTTSQESDTPGEGAKPALSTTPEVMPLDEGQDAPHKAPPADSPQQLERLRKLKAATLQDRATGRNVATEGVH